MTASECRATEPMGQPAMARMWFSNWLMAQASSVQWPELCTRGAISLTMTGSAPPVRHDEEFDGQNAAIAEGIRDARRHLLGECLMLLRAAGGNGARAQDAALVIVLRAIVAGKLAILRAHADGRYLHREIEHGLQHAGSPAEIRESGLELRRG